MAEGGRRPVLVRRLRLLLGAVGIGLVVWWNVRDVKETAERHAAIDAEIDANLPSGDPQAFARPVPREHPPSHALVTLAADAQVDGGVRVTFGSHVWRLAPAQGATDAQDPVAALAGQLRGLLRPHREAHEDAPFWLGGWDVEAGPFGRRVLRTLVDVAGEAGYTPIHMD